MWFSLQADDWMGWIKEEFSCMKALKQLCLAQSNTPLFSFQKKPPPPKKIWNWKWSTWLETQSSSSGRWRISIMWCYATHPLAKIRKERMLTMFRGRGRPKQRESSKLMLLMVVTQLGLTGGFSSRAIRRKERLGGDTNVKRFYFKIRLHERSKKRQRIPLYMEPHFVPVTNSSQSR